VTLGWRRTQRRTLFNDMLVETRTTRVTIVEADITLLRCHTSQDRRLFVESLDRGDEAERKLADAPPDLVILHWMSTGMSASKFVSGCARRTRHECSQLSCSRRGGSLAPTRLRRRGGRFHRQALLNARADSACSCFIATQPVYYRGPPAYSRRPSTRPSDPKGAPGRATSISGQRNSG
jgi:hypothetical protein